MQALIAIIAKLIVGLIKGLINKLKLARLKTDLKSKEEKANEAKNKSDAGITTFRDEYNKFLDSEERRLAELPKSDSDVQSSATESSEKPRRPTSNNRRARRRRKGKGSSNNRARQATKGRAKK